MSETLRQKVARLEVEREWLRRRVSFAGRIGFEDRETGTSSNALVEYALGGAKPSMQQRPRDRDDLMACYRAVRRAPRHLQPIMRPFLRQYRDQLAAERKARAR